ncbi:hypothetical protein ACFLZC_00030 [Patescibacteria group bacterium]
MKNFSALFLVLAVLSFVAVPSFAQNQTIDEKVTVRLSDLPPDMVAKIKAEQTLQNIQAYGEYAKWGQEVGVAVNETLKAITVHSENLSETNVGKFAMFLIAWRILAKDAFGIGQDLMGFLVAIPFLFLGSSINVYFFRRKCIARKVLVKKTKKTKDSPATKEYEVLKPDKASDWAWGILLAEIILIVVCSILMFA